MTDHPKNGILNAIMSELILISFGALVVGCLSGFGLFALHRKNLISSAQKEGQDLIQEIRDRIELEELDQKETLAEIELELWTKDEKLLLKLEESIEELSELSQEKKQKADDQYSVIRQKTVELESQVKKEEDRIKDLDEKYKRVLAEKNKINSQFVTVLCERFQKSPDEVKAEITHDLENEATARAEAWISHVESDTKTHLEIKAKNLLDRALVRFHRLYSAERGIPAVYFENPQKRELIDSPETLQALSDITGCDIFLEPDMDFVGVAGFDPVRRELARRVLERCLKEKRPVTPDFVAKAYDNIKRELLSLVKKDGDAIAKELKIEGLHPEIRQVMGSLRYRYSFTQNQYFHCGEVGFLAGLLASELGTVELKKARRAGLLHDLGKSMDHEMDGGHAVIGANFIQARGEAPDIVHAVRSHHYDEQPSTDLAYLVIAADAISGARPGARRSTMESYNQKVTELETISKSFHGVTDCYVLNGGRECRVIVHGKQVDDRKAMDLSRQIAKRIEEECNYPGQIKVVVVREMTAVESTRNTHN